jgi:hypothetical protein
MIKDRAFLDLVGYAERYYVQYPILTIGIYPPVFYLVESLFFSLFGISTMAARLAILLFTLLGVNLFFLMCRLWFPLGLSVVGSILWLLQPAMLFGQTNVMLEIPALCISMTALYFLHIGTRKNKPWSLFWAPVFASLAFVTKQNTVFLVPVFLMWLAIERKWSLVKSRHFIIGMCVGVIIVTPWMMVSLTVGKSYVAAQILQGKHLWQNAVYYLRHSLEISSSPIVLLTVLSVILFSKLKEHEGYRFGVIWCSSVLLSILPIYYRETRFAIFLIPSLIILSMFVICFLKERVEWLSKRRNVYATVMIAIVLLHCSPKSLWGGRDIHGFDQVADFVVADAECVSVLYDGYFNGIFVFHVRARDTERRIFAFRASKVVFSTKMYVEQGYNELINDVEEFCDVLNRYSVKYVIQEEKDYLGTPANKRLRRWVQDPRFRLVRKYPVAYTGFDGSGDLVVYEFMDYVPAPIVEIEIDMPVMGRRITVKP